MTPAVLAAKKAKIHYLIHEYQHDPAQTAYGLEAAAKLGITPDRVFKTLLTEMEDRRLAVAVIPVSKMLNLKALAKILGHKKAAMAAAAAAERATGYVLGGISPLGQKKKLPTCIDSAACDQATIFISAGRRGLEIELSPHDLASLTRACFAPIATASDP